MPTLNLKPNHKAIRDYQAALDETSRQLNLLHEGAVAPHFANLLRFCAARMGWSLAEQHQIPRKGRRPLRADGVLLDQFKLRHGVWEAKDNADDLALEVRKKFAEGYPQDNILFQAPRRAILVQNGRIVADEDIGRSDRLVEILRLFLEYQPPEYERWETAVAEFRERVPELAASLLTLIETERSQNRAFREALTDFQGLMREAINPNLSDKAVEEMLIQHLLTERIFRKVFNNPDFTRRNIIAREIEKVISALTSRHFSRDDFLRQLDRFYGALEATAATISSFSEKQDFLNTVYEKFFQGFSVKVADTHGIVYTPQPIVDFMVRSVDDILRREFGKAEGLASEGVAILDPFVGTGNFLLRVMRQMPKSKLPQKYAGELFCNEVMLLPYYIASMNIEHEYYELTGRYEPFEGISLVDTFELAKPRQPSLFAPENTQRIQRQKDAPIFVIIGNPPYNAHQVNENDNSKNRKYKALDDGIRETYAKDSRATNKNALSDVYVKAIRWASDRIIDEGIVAFVVNNSFVDGLAFDGMRQHLRQDFNRIYVLDLKGNVRKDSMRDGIPIGEQHTVFGLSAMVGIAVVFLIKDKSSDDHRVFYQEVDFRSTRNEKFDYLENSESAPNIEWREVEPNQRHIWLTEGLQTDFDGFLPIGTKDAKTGDGKAIFDNYGNGVQTNRDIWVYNFLDSVLHQTVTDFIETYNGEVLRWQLRSERQVQVDDFISRDDSKIKWSSNLKSYLQQARHTDYDPIRIRHANYRPFVKQFLYFDEILVHRQGQWPYFFPNIDSENVIIWVKIGSAWPMFALATNRIADQLPQGGSQCFPFYTYNEEGDGRRENITDWALQQFRERYAAAARPEGFSKPFGSPLDKWDIFHYVYALLHHPAYRERYAANLRRELPRIPFVPVGAWPAFVQAGERLAALHVGYEQQPEYGLVHRENPALPLDYRVEKMRLNRERTSLVYNDFLTLDGIPPEAFAYRLGNRSALEWVIDQYQVKTDRRSGITNDPNNPDDETYILRLVKQVITVSLETVALVNGLRAVEVK